MRGTDIGMRTLCRVDVAFAGEALVCQQHRISGNTEMLGQLAGDVQLTIKELRRGRGPTPVAWNWSPWSCAAASMSLRDWYRLFFVFRPFSWKWNYYSL